MNRRRVDERADDYEYRGLMASSWDLLRGDTSGWPDRPVYRAAILDRGEPALDVGCGTGRLLLDYLAEGLDVEGVDNSPEMLEICRRKAGAVGLEPTLYLQSMEALEIPRRYRTIFVPSSSFQLLTDRADASAALSGFRDHLEPGGRLVMAFMILWKEGDRADSKEWRLVAERERPEDGALVRRWSRVRFDVEHQLESTEDRYEVLVNGEVVQTEHHRRSPAVRSYTQEQARDLLGEAGFSDVRVTRGFTDEPATAEDTIFKLFAIRCG